MKNQLNLKEGFELEYAQAIHKALLNGNLQKNRTGVDAYTIFNFNLEIKNINKFFPVLNGKKVFPKLALKEVLWMLMGRTDVKWLNDNGVNYWNEWVLEDGTIGPSYGKQFRDFNGVDQLQNLLDKLFQNPYSRRHIITLWNPNDLDKMSLAPCMWNYLFTIVERVYTVDGIKHIKSTVNIHAHLRSNDAFLGAPYDFMFCAWFLKIVVLWLNNNAKNTKNAFEKKHYLAGNIYYTADNFHVYENHVTQCFQYLRNIFENKGNALNERYHVCDNFETICNDTEIDCILEMLHKNIEDIKLNTIGENVSYHYGTIKAPIAI